MGYTHLVEAAKDTYDCFYRVFKYFAELNVALLMSSKDGQLVYTVTIEV